MAEVAQDSRRGCTDWRVAGKRELQDTVGLILAAPDIVHREKKGKGYFVATHLSLGKVGIWTGALWSAPEEAPKIAEHLDRLGYGALWFPNRQDMFERARQMLDASRTLVVATGIASIWEHPAEEVAAVSHTLTQTFPRRFLLGLGVSHAMVVDRNEAGRYRKPVEHMLAYLDALDAAPHPVPKEERVIAALGPRMLGIARDRSAGSHPYLVTPEHTRTARAALGPDALLAPEQAAVLETDPAKARSIARNHLAMYLQAPNYVNNWRRLGFGDEDFTQGGSDRLIDALVVWGDIPTIAERVTEHLRAGADHVCMQVLTENPAVPPYDQWRALATLTTSVGA